ncbi:hypothetical protein A1Q1_04772 [Trichosporon asahii var. asahii CBS 2479]|uniref:Uncharacterized protein n=1 Tax=Trichosporon asahii var. asahii (strain ATCC 90039 / CBS 2479 / JCM 2466 / KCTC 7840 / NBRC 103889/ NCYC 2677 / UAMH 7654) TaxID=1186058 RepID=J4U852_TRIAS|nr:hypothetical protein A1Q1_04772 [Trichosporon asahii var. asahii CBS 2479]EJT46595.1 hypothetical protein A1Q1_04772 [Trichosporon asahii var. asahii CBS 2479]
MPPSRRRAPPPQAAPAKHSEAAVHSTGSDIGGDPSTNTARPHAGKRRVVSATLPITPSPTSLPAELDSVLTADAELLCEFSYRPNIRKYRLKRRSRIVDVFCIPREDHLAHASAPAPNVQVLLLPSSLHRPPVGPREAKLDRIDRTDDVGSARTRSTDETSIPLRTDSEAARSHRHAGQSYITWPRRTKLPELSWTDTYTDYARLGSTTKPPTLFPGVLEGTGVVFAPLALGEPRDKWPTSIPLPGLKRIVVSFRPTKTKIPGPWVEHLLHLHNFNRPVRETIILFRPGARLDEGYEQDDYDRGHWWLGELLATLFASVPNNNLGAVTVVGLQQAAPGWPGEQGQAASQLKRVLSHFGPQLSPRRDWSDVAAARFLSLDAYEATVTPAEFELETCPV